VPVLVDLWAPWCGPCRMMAPALEQLARERAGRLKIVKLNVDDHPAIAARYRVQGIPLLVLARDGEELARLTGAAPLPRLQGWLDSQLTPAGTS
jgi:thioredoxin 2